MTGKPVQEGGWNGKNLETVFFCLNAPAGPSLSITARNDKVLLHCYAGCTPAAIVAALGLTLSDLFVEKPALNGHKRILKVYPYVDAHGSLVHETVRYEPKAFTQRRPDPA
jgi:putative DNA primase/helicase